jgi:predicted nucleotidyltransferase component of viral defense system
MPKGPSNVAASVRQRLLNRAHERGEDFQLVLIRYTVERLLYRLSLSSYKKQFVLKGAMLFPLWDSDSYRATRDLDLLGYGDSAVSTVEEIFKEICRTPVEKDGIDFLENSIKGEEIRGEHEYTGVRLTFSARLAGARIPIQVDVGFGDAVIPSPEITDYPALLDFPAPRLYTYPREVVVAEKFQSMVVLGIGNSRMKDFYDLWILASGFPFAGPNLSRAIEATFKRRRTPIPEQPPLALTKEFCDDLAKQAQWKAFIRRARLIETEFSLVVAMLWEFLMPLTLAAAQGQEFNAKWPPGGPWSLMVEREETQR